MSLESGGGHWYDDQGNSKHVTPNKSKPGMHPTTLRDARAYRLVPSVTTYLKDVLAKPATLVRWSYKQVAMAALTRGLQPGELMDDDLIDKIIDDAFKQVEDAADAGTGLHDALAHFFAEEPHDPKWDLCVGAVANWCAENGVHILQRELRLVNLKDGYAGTTDALIDSKYGLGILDYKTRKSNPKYPMTPWEDNPAQIAAYYVAKFGEIKDNASGVNLLISMTEPGRVEGTWYTAEDLRREWSLFQSVMNIWRIRKNFDPRQP